MLHFPGMMELLGCRLLGKTLSKKLSIKIGTVHYYEASEYFDIPIDSVTPCRNTIAKNEYARSQNYLEVPLIQFSH